jgi:hypothetical protein
MFTEEAPQPKKFADRLISFGIAGICGYMLGRILEYFAVIFFDQSFGLVWFSTILFSIFGFIAPGKSRALWTRIWTFILEFLHKLNDTRRFYR